MKTRKQRAFTLVELLVVIAIIGILIGMLMPAVQSVREAARRADCLNRMRQIGLATTMFHDVHGAFPPARLYSKKYPLPPFDKGRDQPTWLVRILPFVEQKNFYEQWDLSDSYQNHSSDTTSQVISTYICPSRRSTDDAQVPSSVQEVLVTAPCGCGGWVEVEVVGGATGDYAGNHGDLSPGSIGAETDYYYGGNGTGVIISSQAKERSDGNLDWVDRIRHASIRDGSSNTFLAGELHVTPDNLNTTPYNGPIYNGEDLAAFTRVGGPGIPLLSGGQSTSSMILGFGSWHPGVCNFTFADGSTRSLALSLDTVTLGQLCNRADGEVQVLDR